MEIKPTQEEIDRVLAAARADIEENPDAGQLTFAEGFECALLWILGQGDDPFEED